MDVRNKSEHDAGGELDFVGLSTPIEVIPWARGYKIAQSEPNILLFTAARTPEREEMGFTFIAPAVMWTHGLLAKKDSGIDIQSLEGARLQGVDRSWGSRILAGETSSGSWHRHCRSGRPRNMCPDASGGPR
jgi:hypothetical protein